MEDNEIIVEESNVVATLENANELAQRGGNLVSNMRGIGNLISDTIIETKRIDKELKDAIHSMDLAFEKFVLETNADLEKYKTSVNAELEDRKNERKINLEKYKLTLEPIKKTIDMLLDNIKTLQSKIARIDDDNIELVLKLQDSLDPKIQQLTGLLMQLV